MILEYMSVLHEIGSWLRDYITAIRNGRIHPYTEVIAVEL